MERNEVTVTKFARLSDNGDSFEFKSTSGDTLAYLDDQGNGTSAVFVYDPYRDKGRDYVARQTDLAKAIIVRHVRKLGFELPEEF